MTKVSCSVALLLCVALTNGQGYGNTGSSGRYRPGRNQDDGTNSGFGYTQPLRPVNNGYNDDTINSGFGYTQPLRPVNGDRGPFIQPLRPGGSEFTDDDGTNSGFGFTQPLRPMNNYGGPYTQPLRPFNGGNNQDLYTQPLRPIGGSGNNEGPYTQPLRPGGNDYVIPPNGGYGVPPLNGKQPAFVTRTRGY